MHAIFRIIMFCTIMSLPYAMSAQAINVSTGEAKAWVNYLIPLPKEIAIAGSCRVPRSQVSVRLHSGADDIERQAFAELQALFPATNTTTSANGHFEIKIGVMDTKGRVEGIAVTNADRLKKLPNRDQAYIIEPLGTNGLLVAALDSQGVYFGVQTLRQLLEAKLTSDQVVIPLACITDWPDLEERGMWCGGMRLPLPALKLNLITINSSPKVKIQRDQPIRVNLDTVRFDYVKCHGMRARVQTAHLNYWAQSGLYEAYPELAGKGDKAVPSVPSLKAREMRVPCASNPLMKKVLAEWMTDLAAQGVRDVCVWLSEFPGQCQCEACLKTGQFRAEINASQDAWRDVMQKYPNLKLRVFCCMGGVSSNDTYETIIALDPDVKIERCYGAFKDAFNTATPSRWVGEFVGCGIGQDILVLPVCFYGTWLRDRYRDLHQRQWRAGIFMTDGSEGYYEFFSYLLSALAEWSWNLNGRTPEELGRAWATRQGMAYPDRVAQWVAIMDPLETRWMSASSISGTWAHRGWQEAAASLKDKKAPGDLGGLFYGLTGTNGLPEQMATVVRAMTLAESAQSPELILETRYVLARLQALQALRTLLTQAGKSGPPAEATLPTLRAARDTLTKSVQTMIGVMDQRLDLVKSLSQATREKRKLAHGTLWRQRLDAILAAVNPLLAPKLVFQ